MQTYAMSAFIKCAELSSCTNFPISLTRFMTCYSYTMNVFIVIVTRYNLITAQAWIIMRHYHHLIHLLRHQPVVLLHQYSIILPLLIMRGLLLSAVTVQLMLLLLLIIMILLHLLIHQQIVVMKLIIAHINNCDFNPNRKIHN